jgi:hypothetical protein
VKGGCNITTYFYLLQEKKTISLQPIILCKSNQLAIKKLLIGSPQAVVFCIVLFSLSYECSVKSVLRKKPLEKLLK